MQCPSCRGPNDDDADVCFTCGARLSSASPIKQGDVIAERYVVRARLGRGGMGTVYKAYDRALEEDVALKVMGSDAGVDAELERRFRSEIRLARKITDRNVCRIYDYGESEGRRFISMELIDGIDLKRLLKELGAFPPKAAYDVALQVAWGLEAIHEAGIIHRDLKTLNVMRDRRGQVKVMDFGIARRVEQDADSSNTTGTGRVVGTPDYMSPEQARGEKVDIRSDIYALGVVIFEIFTGTLPFRADTPMAVLLKHLNEPPPLEGPAARLLPEALRPVLRRALAKQRAERYSSVRELIDDLEDARARDPAGPAVARPPVVLGAAVPDTESLLAPTPVPGRVTEPATAASVTLSGRATARRTWRAGLAVMAFALAGTAAVYQRWSATEKGAPPEPDAAQSPVPSMAPPPATGALAVTINALPWARLKLAAVDDRAAVPRFGEDERVTPVRVLLPEGQYTVELENGGITPTLRERVHVRAGEANAFVFVMPGYDPGTAAGVQP